MNIICLINFYFNKNKMGLCESSQVDKKIQIVEHQNSNKANISQKLEDENSINKETHPSSNSQLDNKSPKNQEIKENKCPELAKYNRSQIYSGLRSECSHINNTQSVFSAGQTEEEVIVKGEINKNCKNKEEDFDNNSFKKLVKNNGGIIIKNGDQNSNICSSQGKDFIFDFGKETISEIKSKHSFPFKHINGNFKTNLRGSGSTFDFLLNNMSENNQNLINQRKNNNMALNNLRGSNKINISMYDNCQFLNVPRVDEPLPDIDELSNESPLLIGRNSLISE
jgi:hypothetical protein